MGRVLASDDAVRVISFAVVFATMAAWEFVAGRRGLVAGRGARWPTNLTMLVLGIGVVRVLMPLTVVEIAGIGSSRRWGVLGLLSLPPGVAMAFSVVALDLALYLQHLTFHHIPVLWRVHRVHHADPDFDVTTGLRFHPLEFMVSAIVKVVAVLIIGAPAGAVARSTSIVSVSACWCRLSRHLRDSPQRLVDVYAWQPSRSPRPSIPQLAGSSSRCPTNKDKSTPPDMHRIHHSVEGTEHDTNFGFNLAVWDRLFRTYRQDPEAGHDDMTIGLGVDPDRATNLLSSLRFPFGERQSKFERGRGPR